ncbi:MAG: TetR/AcrR family transcriptional regulator, partial [Acidimicrobiia bacterium]|nr:TetR/AcrR family transcriptional regulator [Acidimicrobiia bacterium]
APDTRARLTDAAARVLARDGFERARVSAIASDAGLTTGAIYFHYADRASLLADSVLRHGPGELADLLEGASSGTLPELMRSVGAVLGHRSEDDGALLVEAIVASRRQPSVGEALRHHLEAREASLVELGREAQAGGLLDPDLPIDASVRFWVMLAMGSLLLKALDLEGPDTDDWKALMDRIISALRQPQPPEETS